MQFSAIFQTVNVTCRHCGSQYKLWHAVIELVSHLYCLQLGLHKLTINRYKVFKV